MQFFRINIIALLILFSFVFIFSHIWTWKETHPNNPTLTSLKENVFFSFTEKCKGTGVVWPDCVSFGPCRNRLLWPAIHGCFPNNSEYNLSWFLYFAVVCVAYYNCIAGAVPWRDVSSGDWNKWCHVWFLHIKLYPLNESCGILFDTHVTWLPTS